MSQDLAKAGQSCGKQAPHATGKSSLQTGGAVCHPAWLLRAVLIQRRGTRLEREGEGVGRAADRAAFGCPALQGTNSQGVDTGAGAGKALLQCLSQVLSSACQRSRTALECPAPDAYGTCFTFSPRWQVQVSEENALLMRETVLSSFTLSNIVGGCRHALCQ